MIGRQTGRGGDADRSVGQAGGGDRRQPRHRPRDRAGLRRGGSGRVALRPQRPGLEPCARRSRRTASWRTSQACDVADGAALAAYIAAAAEALGGIDSWCATPRVRHERRRGGLAAQHRCRPAGDGARVACGDAVSWKQRGAVPSSTSRRSRASARSARTPPYGAVKAAVIHYTQSEAAALARKGIRVNCIAPGSIEFPGGIWDRARPTTRSSTARSCAASRSAGSAEPEEVARVAVFLASPLAELGHRPTIWSDGGQLRFRRPGPGPGPPPRAGEGDERGK